MKTSPPKSTASARFPAPAVAAPATAVIEAEPSEESPQSPRLRRPRATVNTAVTKHFTANHSDEHLHNRQAELFYLQKQIQQQTQMVFVMEDGARLQGVVEWYDRHSIKVRGKTRVLIYKTAIKYLYKAGEIGTAPSQ